MFLGGIQFPTEMQAKLSSASPWGERTVFLPCPDAEEMQADSLMRVAFVPHLKQMLKMPLERGQKEVCSPKVRRSLLCTRLRPLALRSVHEQCHLVGRAGMGRLIPTRQVPSRPWLCPSTAGEEHAPCSGCCDR